jgi:hypothetical protein
MLWVPSLIATGPNYTEETIMIDLDDIDIDSLKAARRYPTFDAKDDDFHDEVLTDHWWETETNWFSWNIPRRKMGGWTYCQARPNADICNGGVWIWDDTASLPWELPYHVNYSGLRLPKRSERDMRDFEWPNGVRIVADEPLKKYTIRYEDSGQLSLNLEFEAITPPNPHPIGVTPFYRGTHFDQPGRVTGEMNLHGESIAIDCLSFRDRSWGPRPMGRPKKPRDGANTAASGFGGVGYSFAAASQREAWLVYSTPGVDSDPVACGFLLRAGEYGHILGGERRLNFDRATGWPTAMEIDAVDEFNRRLHVRGEALSRHWKGHGGDTLFHWKWDDLDGWGEDQSYFLRNVWAANKARSPEGSRATLQPESLSNITR